MFYKREIIKQNFKDAKDAETNESELKRKNEALELLYWKNRTSVKPSKIRYYNEQRTLGEAKINYVVQYWKRNLQDKDFWEDRMMFQERCGRLERESNLKPITELDGWKFERMTG